MVNVFTLKELPHPISATSKGVIMVKRLYACALLLVCAGCNPMLTAEVPLFEVEPTDSNGFYVCVFEDTRVNRKIVPEGVSGPFSTANFEPYYAQPVAEYVTNHFKAKLIQHGIPITGQPTEDSYQITGVLNRFEANISSGQWEWTCNVELSVTFNNRTQRVTGRAVKTNWQQMKSGVQALDLAINDALSKIDYSLFDKN